LEAKISIKSVRLYPVYTAVTIDEEQFHLSCALQCIFSAFLAPPQCSLRSPEGLPRSTKVYQGLPRSTMVYQGLPRSTKVYQGLPRSTKVYQGLPRSTKVYQGLPRSTNALFYIKCGSAAVGASKYADLGISYKYPQGTGDIEDNIV
jgi:hypothetical protein